MTHDTLKTFRLPTETMAAVKQRAAKERVSASEVLRRAVGEYLARPIPKPKRKRGGLQRKT